MATDEPGGLRDDDPGGGPAGDLPGAAGDLAVEVLRHGPLARGQLARRLGLSAGSLTRLSKPLLRSGVLVETATSADPDTRRPTRPLDVAAGSRRVVGVDLTGTDAWGVLTDLRAGVLAASRAPLADRSPAGVAAAVVRLVERLTATPAGPARRPSAVGVAVGGPVEAATRVLRAPFLGWSAPVDLGALLRPALGGSVVVGNDLAALTRGEHWFGEGRGTTAFAVVTVGAGVGYGLVLHDRVVETPATGLQLLGHHPLRAGGPRCEEGHAGCATAVLTTRALAAAGGLALRRRVDPEELLDLAEAGDAVAGAVVDDAARGLGRLVATVANVTGIERVLLTGEGVRLAEVGWAALSAQVAEDRDPLAPALDLVVRPHDFAVWARGAAGMAVQALVRSPAWLVGAASA